MTAESAFRIEKSKLYKELKEAEARLTLELFEAEHENLIGV